MKTEDYIRTFLEIKGITPSDEEIESFVRGVTVGKEYMKDSIVDYIYEWVKPMCAINNGQTKLLIQEIASQIQSEDINSF